MSSPQQASLRRGGDELRPLSNDGVDSTTSTPQIFKRRRRVVAVSSHDAVAATATGRVSFAQPLPSPDGLTLDSTSNVSEATLPQRPAAHSSGRSIHAAATRKSSQERQLDLDIDNILAATRERRQQQQQASVSANAVTLPILNTLGIATSPASTVLGRSPATSTLDGGFASLPPSSASCSQMAQDISLVALSTPILPPISVRGEKSSAREERSAAELADAVDAILRSTLLTSSPQAGTAHSIVSSTSSAGIVAQVSSIAFGGTGLTSDLAAEEAAFREVPRIPTVTHNSNKASSPDHFFDTNNHRYSTYNGGSSAVDGSLGTPSEATSVRMSMFTPATTGIVIPHKRGLHPPYGGYQLAAPSASGRGPPTKPRRRRTGARKSARSTSISANNINNNNNNSGGGDSPSSNINKKGGTIKARSGKSVTPRMRKDSARTPTDPAAVVAPKARSARGRTSSTAAPSLPSKLPPVAIFTGSLLVPVLLPPMTHLQSPFPPYESTDRAEMQSDSRGLDDFNDKHSRSCRNFGNSDTEEDYYTTGSGDSTEYDSDNGALSITSLPEEPTALVMIDTCASSVLFQQTPGAELLEPTQKHKPAACGGFRRLGRKAQEVRFKTREDDLHASQRSNTDVMATRGSSTVLSAVDFISPVATPEPVDQCPAEPEEVKVPTSPETVTEGVVEVELEPITETADHTVKRLVAAAFCHTPSFLAEETFTKHSLYELVAVQFPERDTPHEISTSKSSEYLVAREESSVGTAWELVAIHPLERRSLLAFSHVKARDSLAANMRHPSEPKSTRTLPASSSSPMQQRPSVDFCNSDCGSSTPSEGMLDTADVQVSSANTCDVLGGCAGLHSEQEVWTLSQLQEVHPREDGDGESAAVLLDADKGNTERSMEDRRDSMSTSTEVNVYINNSTIGGTECVESPTSGSEPPSTEGVFWGTRPSLYVHEVYACTLPSLRVDIRMSWGDGDDMVYDRETGEAHQQRLVYRRPMQSTIETYPQVRDSHERITAATATALPPCTDQLPTEFVQEPVIVCRCSEGDITAVAAGEDAPPVLERLLEEPEEGKEQKKEEKIALVDDEKQEQNQAQEGEEQKVKPPQLPEDVEVADMLEIAMTLRSTGSGSLEGYESPFSHAARAREKRFRVKEVRVLSPPIVPTTAVEIPKQPGPTILERTPTSQRSKERAKKEREERKNHTTQLASTQEGDMDDELARVIALSLQDFSASTAASHEADWEKCRGPMRLSAYQEFPQQMHSYEYGKVVSPQVLHALTYEDRGEFTAPPHRSLQAREGRNVVAFETLAVAEESVEHAMEAPEEPSVAAAVVEKPHRKHEEKKSCSKKERAPTLPPPPQEREEEIDPGILAFLSAEEEEANRARQLEELLTEEYNARQELRNQEKKERKPLLQILTAAEEQNARLEIRNQEKAERRPLQKFLTYSEKEKIKRTKKVKELVAEEHDARRKILREEKEERRPFSRSLRWLRSQEEQEQQQPESAPQSLPGIVTQEDWELMEALMMIEEQERREAEARTVMGEVVVSVQPVSSYESRAWRQARERETSSTAEWRTNNNREDADAMVVALAPVRSYESRGSVHESLVTDQAASSFAASEVLEEVFVSPPLHNWESQRHGDGDPGPARPTEAEGVHLLLIQHASEGVLPLPDGERQNLSNTTYEQRYEFTGSELVVPLPHLKGTEGRQGGITERIVFVEAVEHYNVDEERNPRNRRILPVVRSLHPQLSSSEASPCYPEAAERARLHALSQVRPQEHVTLGQRTDYNYVREDGADPDSALLLSSIESRRAVPREDHLEGVYIDELGYSLARVESARRLPLCSYRDTAPHVEGLPHAESSSVPARIVSRETSQQRNEVMRSGEDQEDPGNGGGGDFSALFALSTQENHDGSEVPVSFAASYDGGGGGESPAAAAAATASSSPPLPLKGEEIDRSRTFLENPKGAAERDGDQQQQQQQHSDVQRQCETQLNESALRQLTAQEEVPPPLLRGYDTLHGQIMGLLFLPVPTALQHQVSPTKIARCNCLLTTGTLRRHLDEWHFPTSLTAICGGQQRFSFSSPPPCRPLS